jgi:hypothetical protein
MDCFVNCVELRMMWCVGIATMQSSEFVQVIIVTSDEAPN